MHFSLQTLVVLGYFSLVIAVGVYAKKFTKSTEDFLTAGRNLGAGLVAVAVAGEWLGGMTTIGVSERAYVTGISSAWYNISTATGMVLFALFLAKKYRKHNVTTVAEMIEHLYNKRVRIVSALCFIIAYFILAYIQVQACGVLLAGVLGVKVPLGIVVSGAVVVVYTLAGGLWSIGLTNLMHMIVIYFSLLLAFGVTMVKVGGYAGLMNALSTTVHLSTEAKNYFNPFGVGYQKVFAWIIGGIFGAFAAQASIQPVFAAKDCNTARKGAILSALMVAPIGIITATLGVAAATRYNLSSASRALPTLLSDPTFLPPWIGALAMAGILAAILSTTAPVMFAISTMLTKDIYEYLKPGTSDKKLLGIGRILTVAVVITATLLALVMKGLILDTAYICYAIRCAGAVLVIMGIYWTTTREGIRYSIPSTRAATLAILGGTVAGVFFAVGEAFHWIHINKVYASIIISFILLLVGTLVLREKPRALSD